MNNNQVRLGVLMRARGKLDSAAVIELAVGLADAIAVAEKAGVGSSPSAGRVVLMPDSFVVDPTGHVELRPGRGAPPDSRAGFRTWAAPEQIRGEEGTLRSWMFSIGAILYEAATGDALFEAASPPVANSLVVDDLESHLMMAAVRGRMRAVRPGFETLIKSCLEDDPQRRPDNPAVLKVLLEDLLDSADRDSLGVLVDSYLSTGQEDDGDESMETLVSQGAMSAPASDLGRGAPASEESVSDLSGESDFPGFWENAAGDSFYDGLPGETLPGDPSLPAVGGDGPPSFPSFDFGAEEEEALEEGLGGQSLEIQLDRAGQPEPVRPLRSWDPDQSGDASTDGESDSGDAEPRPASRSSADPVDMELKTARVRPIREIPPAVTTGARRLVKLVVVLVLLIIMVFATIWLEVVPDLPDSVTAPIETVFEPVGAAMPSGVRSWFAGAWDRRSEGERADRVWNALVDVMPSEVQRQMRPPPDAKALLSWPGDVTAGGFVRAVSPSMEITPGLPDMSGSLTLSIAYEGGTRALRGTMTWTAVPAADPRPAELEKDIRRAEGPTPISTVPDREQQTGEGTGPITLPAGWWDISLSYTESELTDSWSAQIAGVRISPGYATKMAASVAIPAGRLEPRMLLDGQDSEEEFTLALYDAASAKAVQEAEEAARQTAFKANEEPRATTLPPTVDTVVPLWMGKVSELPALPEGPVVARVAFDDGAHWPSVSWYEDVVIPANMRAAEPVWRLERDEPLNPTGPGLRLLATNNGRDITRKTQVFLYRAEDNVLHAAAIAKGRAGKYFDVPAGEYNLRLVYQPLGPSSSVFGERVVTGFKVAEKGVTEGAVDLEYAMAWLDLKVIDDDEDISRDVELVVLREGVDRDAGKRILDEEGVGQHVLPADTYDIYVVYKPRDERAPIDVVFRSVTLETGDRWEQLWDARKTPWTATPPKQ